MGEVPLPVLQWVLFIPPVGEVLVALATVWGRRPSREGGLVGEVPLPFELPCDLDGRLSDMLVGEVPLPAS